MNTKILVVFAVMGWGAAISAGVLVKTGHFEYAGNTPLASCIPVPSMPIPKEDFRRVYIERDVTALTAANKDLKERLNQSVVAHSRCEVTAAKKAGKYPMSEAVRPGTSIIAGISLDKVFVKQGDGTLAPFTIGQTIPGAGRLLSIDVGKGEAVAEGTRLMTEAQLLKLVGN